MLPETAAHLWDALEAARAARDFTEGIVYHEFTGDLMRRSAVERLFRFGGVVRCSVGV